MDEMENCLTPAAQDLAEARLAAKRAARAEAREIRMKELERQQKEVEERPDKDFNDKGARTASSLSAATLASLGGTSSRRGSCDTSISVDTEASIREIKDISDLKDQIEDVEGRYIQGLKELKDSLAEVEEKYKKAMVSNAQLDNEKTNFMYQVDTLKDVLLELEEQLAETHRQYAEKSKEFEREKHSHRTLQIQYNELKESLQQRDELLTRHGIVLSSDLSPNGGILDGPLREALVESSTNAAPVSKTGDGPLGRASEVKRKSETAEEGPSVQSSKTAECTEDAGVQSSTKVHTEENSLLSQREEEAEGSMGSSVGQACMSADGQTESVTNAGEQVAKTDSLQNGDSINRSGMGLDATAVTNPAVNGSSEATAGHVEETDTLQTQRDVEIKGSMGNQMGELEFERATCSEKESPCDVFQDAVEFANGQNISTEKELHNRDTCIVATNEEPQEKPHLESPSEGCNVQGILQNLGRHLDMVFDADKDKVNGTVHSVSDLSEDSSPQNIQQELEGSGASAQQLDGDKSSMMTTEGSVACPKGAAGTKDGEDIASEKLLERSVVNTELINSCGDGSMAVGGSIQSQADGAIPLGEKGIDPDLVPSENCVALGHHEVKNHVEEVDLEFYECLSEGSNSARPSLETKLREEPLNNTQHQEASNVGFNVSSPHTLEEMDTNTNEQLADKVRDDPSQVSHMHNPDTQFCNAKEEDEEKIEKQGAEGNGTFASPGHDNKEDGTAKTASQYNLTESEQSGETQNDGDTLEFNEDSENMDPSPTVDQEFVKESAEEEHMNASTPINSAEIPVQAGTRFQNKGVLTEGNKDFHEEGLSAETTKQETEVSFLPPSEETSNIELKHDSEPSTQSPSMENTFVEPSEPLGLSDSSGYSKEDTLDRNVKRTKSKNKDDCLLS